jgi:hypothetical protein
MILHPRIKFEFVRDLISDVGEARLSKQDESSALLKIQLRKGRVAITFQWQHVATCQSLRLAEM